MAGSWDKSGNKSKPSVEERRNVFELPTQYAEILKLGEEDPLIGPSDKELLRQYAKFYYSTGGGNSSRYGLRIHQPVKSSYSKDGFTAEDVAYFSHPGGGFPIRRFTPIQQTEKPVPPSVSKVPKQIQQKTKSVSIPDVEPELIMPDVVEDDLDVDAPANTMEQSFKDFKKVKPELWHRSSSGWRRNRDLSTGL